VNATMKGSSKDHGGEKHDVLSEEIAQAVVLPPCAGLGDRIVEDRSVALANEGGKPDNDERNTEQTAEPPPFPSIRRFSQIRL